MLTTMMTIAAASGQESISRRRRTCVLTRREGVDKEFCFDFVTEEAELAAAAWGCGEIEARGLAARGLEAVRLAGDAAEAEGRRRFEEYARSEEAFETACDAPCRSKVARERLEIQALLAGELPEPEARCHNISGRIRAACPLSRAYGKVDQPGSASDWFALGKAWAESEDYGHAMAALLRARSLGATDQNGVDLHLASIWSAWGDVDVAVGVYGRVVARATVSGDRGLAVAARISALVAALPPLAPPDLAPLRARFRSDLAALAFGPTAFFRSSEKLDATFLARHVGRTLFHLAHHCLDDVEDVRLFGLVWRRVSNVVDHPPRSSSEKKEELRVGFASAHLRDHSIGKMLAELLALLAAEAYVVVFHVGGGGDEEEDFVRSFINSRVDVAREVPRADVGAAQRAIASEGLDVLVFPDVGMEPWSYLLSFGRLARVQCAWWGHPVTTGLETVDFYLSLDTEPDEAKDHYAEQVVRMDFVNTAPFVPVLDLEERLGDALVPRREVFGVDDAVVVYLVLGRLFKLHPAFDDIILDLLEQHETSVVAFVAEPQRPLTAAFWRRLEARFVSLEFQQQQQQQQQLGDRVRVVDYWHYVQALARADVVLDTYPYGGCLTALDALSNSKPFVTLPGPLERGRFAMSIYRQMNLTDFVAATPADFVRIAANLGKNPEARRSAAVRIQRAYPRAHRLAEVAAEWTALFQRLRRAAAYSTPSQN
ncbi:hypothetical protein CTAYLR_009570 [Chrysophaeum taylorii]|uniref:O-GlcNAc transferase C-terminal domain-containing protein n=1 Tax=Chrysophaeum taylorii TaxID=2483200 RepID=A0AAD7UHI0_9STRA|nr:hypothetical protein CTAYLR_009570 [Chrysophaeum taylorii]